ncbi:hypothetical protein ACJU26_04235 [Acidithiobacillus sp. M4-SHS-6]|uniref:hypothetical protein n=1 Tax=Acidithiobacillus sp. M4-SHS-6 TaxID=3383024 RepID=UPI0039BDEE8E
MTFAIGGRLDAPTLAAIATIPETAWAPYADCAVAETVQSMEHTEKAFRLIVVRYRHQAELLEEDRPRYHVIASNRSGSTADVLVWNLQRGECSENGIKDLKIGFGMEHMPCGQEGANAAFSGSGSSPTISSCSSNTRPSPKAGNGIASPPCAGGCFRCQADSSAMPGAGC